jgi:hypothetical protein
VPLGERRDPQPHDGEPVVEVGAEAPGLDLGLEVAWWPNHSRRPRGSGRADWTHLPDSDAEQRFASEIEVDRQGKRVPGGRPATCRGRSAPVKARAPIELGLSSLGIGPR